MSSVPERPSTPTGGQEQQTPISPRPRKRPFSQMLTAQKLAAHDAAQSEESRLQAELAQRYEKLNALWKQAEEQLRLFLLPLQVVHVYHNEVDERREEDYRKCIAWAWAKGNWHICFGAVSEGWSESLPYDLVPILDASLAIRQECIPHFSELKKKVIESAKQIIPKLDESIAQFSAVLK